jgi:short-subunit dehydrogenase
MKDLKGRNAIITGASYGIGPYFARALAEEGVNIALAARSTDKLKQVVNNVSMPGVKIIAVTADVTKQFGREALITQAESELGPIDILINNAGVHYIGRLHHRTQEQLDQIIQTNLTASIMLTRAVLSGMLERRSGHIIHSASLAGKVGMPYVAVYSATKYGLVGFNNALQAELRGTGVHSTAMCWGFISREGMWARFKRPVHIAFGTTPPERVATLLVRAIKQNRIEQVINPIPVQPVLALWALAPRLAAQLFNVLRVNHFLRNVAVIAEVDNSVLSDQ